MTSNKKRKTTEYNIPTYLQQDIVDDNTIDVNTCVGTELIGRYFIYQYGEKGVKQIWFGRITEIKEEEEKDGRNFFYGCSSSNINTWDIKKISYLTLPKDGYLLQTNVYGDLNKQMGWTLVTPLKSASIMFKAIIDNIDIQHDERRAAVASFKFRNPTTKSNRSLTLAERLKAVNKEISELLEQQKKILREQDLNWPKEGYRDGTLDDTGTEMIYFKEEELNAFYAKKTSVNAIANFHKLELTDTERCCPDIFVPEKLIAEFKRFSKNMNTDGIGKAIKYRLWAQVKEPHNSYRILLVYIAESKPEDDPTWKMQKELLVEHGIELMTSREYRERFFDKNL